MCLRSQRDFETAPFMKCLDRLVRDKDPKVGTTRTQIEDAQRRVKDSLNGDAVFSRIRLAGYNTFMRVCVSTCVYIMNHCVGTGVYSEAGLSVSITPLWLSLPGPLSTQTCLNTYTQRQEAC